MDSNPALLPTRVQLEGNALIDLWRHVVFFRKRNRSHAVFLVIYIRHPHWKSWIEPVENILVFCCCTHFILISHDNFFLVEIVMHFLFVAF